MSALEAVILSVLRTPRETSGSLVPESDTRLIEIEEHDLLLCRDLRQQEAKPLPRSCSLFKEMKKVIVRETLLAFSDFNKPFEIHTDASKI